MQKNIEEMTIISWKEAKKRSEERVVDGVVKKKQDVNFHYARKLRAEGKEIVFFKTGEGQNEGIGFVIDSFTKRLQKNWDLDNSKMWAIEHYRLDHSLANLTNHAKSNFEGVSVANMTFGSKDVAQRKIDASKRFEMASAAIGHFTKESVIIKHLILEDMSIRVLKKVLHAHHDTIKKYAIQGIDKITEVYKKIYGYK